MDGNTRDDVIEIDLQEIVGLLFHWAWLLVTCGIMAGLVGFMISKFVLVPQYQSTTSVYILSKSNNSSLTVSDTQLATQLTKDYEQLITSRHVLERVLEELNLTEYYTYASLAEKVSVQNTKDTRIINITVKDENPVVAKMIADAIRNVSAEKIVDVMDVDAVNLVDEGSLPTEPSEPSVRDWTLIATALGIVLAAALVLVRFILDDTIKSSDDIEKYLGLSTLALIPDADTEEKSKKYKFKSFKSSGSSKAVSEPVHSGSSGHEENEQVEEDDVEIIDYNEREG
ncbi:MAG: Wzz/FepE/Etk N-terminal domain-containing protein [Clostridium sp.]|nr:Wzz/FepE/Etk N-terminal domain-containing protein [Acetatifactor muris]MCM1527329.1 Wzz/FepE/Etk N-terminal domain-containing protein [Bacteroides sp.]MCM1563608.1 Wzz/FepE/Etk N-terminal domain-containing protein [Clostridium sp.]